jgi:hypothetical protein
MKWPSSWEKFCRLSDGDVAVAVVGDEVRVQRGELRVDRGPLPDVGRNAKFDGAFCRKKTTILPG